MTKEPVDAGSASAPALPSGSTTSSTDEVALAQRAEELRRILAAPSEKERAAAELVRVEQQLMEARDAQHRHAADARLLGIRRAYGSVAASLDADEQRVREKVAELAAAIARLNERYGQARALRAEAAALSHRFGLPLPALPSVLAPAQRDLDLTPAVGLARPGHSLPAMERCEHGLRERRTYEEVRGAEGFRIIEAAGRKPWPALNERQVRIVEQRAREQQEAERQLAGLAETVRAIENAPGGAIGSSLSL